MSNAMSNADKILLVDDEPSVLNSFKRHFRKDFSIFTATSGQEALKWVKKEGPFAVIVSDMRMPEMTGLELLKQMKKVSPDTTRMMLTGNADQQTATDAVNEGNIFRFYSKPCTTEEFGQGLKAGIRQYQLITAERDLLQHTLAGSVKLLVGVLSLTTPDSFGRATRVRNWVRDVAKFLKLPRTWELEIGSMLTPLGDVAVPHELRAKEQAGTQLTKDEKDALRKAPEVGYRLLENIPRLGDVAKVVLYHKKDFDGSGFPDDKVAGEDIPLGARLVRILNDLARLAPKSHPTMSELARLGSVEGRYDPELLQGVTDYFMELEESQPENTESYKEVSISELMADDVLVSNLEDEDGHLYLAEGGTLTEAAVEQVKYFQKGKKWKEPVKILRLAKL